MTWNHYNAELVDINGRKAAASIRCDKHTPKIISANLTFELPDGTHGWSVIHGNAANNAEGERYLLGRIRAYAAEHGLKFTTEEFTEFSNTKQKL